MGGPTLAALDLHQVNVYLKAHPGHRANASRFLAWLAAQDGNALSPGKGRKPRVLAITPVEAFTTIAGSVVLWAGRRKVILNKGLSAAFRLHADKGRLAFPSRNPAQPLSTSAVARQIRSRTAR